MFPHRPRYPAPPMAASPWPCEQLTRLVYELLDAHDDTARIASGQNLDAHWQAHLSYLRDLQRVARELLARAVQQEGAHVFAPAEAPTREARIAVSGVCRSEYHPRSSPEYEQRPSMKQPATGAWAPAAATRPLPSEDCEPGSVGIVNRCSRQTPISWSACA
jgi:hypothetical protein